MIIFKVTTRNLVNIFETFFARYANVFAVCVCFSFSSSSYNCNRYRYHCWLPMSLYLFRFVFLLRSFGAFIFVRLHTPTFEWNPNAIWIERQSTQSTAKAIFKFWLVYIWYAPIVNSGYLSSSNNVSFRLLEYVYIVSVVYNTFGGHNQLNWIELNRMLSPEIQQLKEHILSSQKFN